MLALLTNLSISVLIFISQKKRALQGFDGKSSQECSVNAGVPQCSMLDPTFSCYALMIFLTMLPVILVSILDDTALYCKCDWPSDVCHQPDLAPEFEFGLQDTQDLQKKWLNTLNAQETQLDLFDCLNNWCY